MFESGQFDTDLRSYRAQRSALTYVTILVIAGSLVYFCTVFGSEVYQTVCEERLQAKAKRAKTGGANKPGSLRRVSMLASGRDGAANTQANRERMGRQLGLITQRSGRNLGFEDTQEHPDRDSGSDEDTNEMQVEMNPMLAAQERAAAGKSRSNSAVASLAQQVANMREQGSGSAFAAATRQAPSRRRGRGGRTEFGPATIGARRRGISAPTAPPRSAVAAGAKAATAEAVSLAPVSQDVADPRRARLTPEERRRRARERMKARAKG